MPYRLQIDSNKNGVCKADDVQVFEWELVTDPVTDADVSTPLRVVKLKKADRDAIVDAINAVMGGDAKRAQRIADARADRAAQQAQQAQVTP